MGAALLSVSQFAGGFGFAGSAKTLQQAKDTLVMLASGVKRCGVLRRDTMGPQLTRELGE